MPRLLKRASLAVLLLLVGIQFVPEPRTNPPVTREVRWNAPDTRALAARACFDCHSNLTTWPWYSHIQPSSYLVVNHVVDGRSHLNFSEWDRPQHASTDEVNEQMSSGDMPIWNYVLMHRTANLSPAEKTQLMDGLRATFQQDPPIPRHH